MIKTFLKHAIFETAINVFFEKMRYSFNTESIVSRGFSVGDKFNSISITYVDEDSSDYEENAHIFTTFYECEIVQINNDSIFINYVGYDEDIYDIDGVLIEELGDTLADREVISISEIVALND